MQNYSWLVRIRKEKCSTSVSAWLSELVGVLVIFITILPLHRTGRVGAGSFQGGHPGHGNFDSLVIQSFGERGSAYRTVPAQCVEC